MTGKVQPFTSSLLEVPHGFFSREGGVSHGCYASLNGGVTTEDLPNNVRKNRQLMADYFHVGEEHFLGLKQIHSPEVVTVRADMPLWSLCSSPEADALVTDRAGLVVTVATADCAPVLFSSGDGSVVGVAHAGWRGAVDGVLEATLKAMRALGAKDIKAVIGPCIGPASYEVSSDMKDKLTARHADGDAMFTALPEEGQFLFDLPGFCEKILRDNGVTYCENLALDTVKDHRFYSYRRSTLAGEKATGRQISAIKVRSL